MRRSRSIRSAVHAVGPARAQPAQLPQLSAHHAVARGTAAVWVAGAFAEGDARLAVWTLALALEFLAPAIGFFVPGLGRSTVADWDIAGDHMAERCGLFIIIALGESILVMGSTFGRMAITPATIAAFVGRVRRQRCDVVDLFQHRSREGAPQHRGGERSRPPRAPRLHLFPHSDRRRHHRVGGRRRGRPGAPGRHDRGLGRMRRARRPGALPRSATSCSSARSGAACRCRTSVAWRCWRR